MERPGQQGPLTAHTDAAEALELGATLRDARLSHRRELADVAAELRIREQYLKAIEEGRLADLPGTTYAFGFVRAYAEYLGLNAGDIARRFREAAGGGAGQLNLVLPSPVAEGRMPTGAILLVAAIIALGAYGGWYYLSTQGRDAGQMIAALPDRIEALIHRESAPDTAPPSMPPPLAAPPASVPAPAAASVPPAAGGDVPSAAPAPAAAPASADSTAAAPPALPAVSVPLTPETTQAPTAPTEPPAAAAPAEPDEDSAPQPPERIDAAVPPATATPMPAEAPVATAPVAAPIVARPAATPERSVTVERLPPRPPAKPDVGAAASSAPPPPPAPPIATAEAVPPPPAPPATSPHDIVLVANSDSWVELQGPTGDRIYSRVLRAGERYEVPNETGLTMMTGNAGGLQVIVDGKTAPSLGAIGAVRRDIPLDPVRLLAGTAVPPQP